MLPVDRSANDPFYRYQMPEAAVAQETSKTVIQNLDQVAKALNRNSTHILKFLSIHFGCTCSFSPRSALNGSFETKRVQDGIYDFIDLFVLCKECRNPETRFVHGDVLRRTCDSCGAVFDQDPHKLNILISRDKGAGEDKKYEKSNRSDIHVLIKEDRNNSDRIFEVFKQEECTLGQVFSEYVKSKELRQLTRVLKEFGTCEVLECIEEMLVTHKKEDRIEEYVKSLIEMGFSPSSICEYISKPRAKKRSPLIKKRFDQIYDDICEDSE